VDPSKVCTCHVDLPPFPIIDEPIPAGTTLETAAPPPPLMRAGALEAREKAVWPLMAGCADGQCIAVHYFPTPLGHAKFYLQRQGAHFVRKYFEGNTAAYMAQNFPKMLNLYEFNHVSQ